MQTFWKQIPILDNPLMYQNDNEVYTARPHCQPPATNAVNVLCSFDKTSRQYRIFASCSFACELEQKPTAIRDLCNLEDQFSLGLIASSPRFALGALERRSLMIHEEILQDFSSTLEKLVNDLHACCNPH